MPVWFIITITLSLAWLVYETHGLSVRLLSGVYTIEQPKRLTKPQRLIEEAQYLALDEIASLTHFVEGDESLLRQCLDTTIREINNELGLRNMPYHGGAHSLFPEFNSHQLDTMLTTYEGFYHSI